MKSLLRRDVALPALLLSAPAGLAAAAAAIWAQGAWPWALAGAVLVFAAASAHCRATARAADRVRLYLAGLPGAAAETPDIAAGSPLSPLAAVAVVAGRNLARERAELGRHALAAETVLATLPLAVLRLDRAGTVIAANPAAKALLSTDPSGRDFPGLLRDPGLSEAVSAVLAGAEGREAEFVVHAAADIWLRALVRPLVPGAEGGAAALVVLHDRSALVRLDRMRADFIANVSHELKTPLATLIGFIETLRGPAVGDTAAREKFLTIMHEQAARMARLVDDIVSLSRIETEDHRPPKGNVAVLPAVRAVTEALQMQAKRRRIVFEIDTAGLPAEAFVVAGDRDRIHQVLQNLIDNAIKYGRENSTVRIAVAEASPDLLPAPRDPGAEKPAAAVEIAVIDQGEGIAPEHIERLTERFYRVDRGRSRQMGGTGLGLAIVKHILLRHGGALSIESRIGQGSRFAVVLPAPAPA